MKEKNQLAVIVCICLFLAGVSIFFSFGTGLSFEPDLVADSYTAVLENDGTLTETYVYDVAYAGTYRMLFRTWDDTFAFEEQQTPYVEYIDVVAPDDMVGYAIDSGGNSVVTGTGAEAQRSLIESLGEYNEMGIFRETRLDAGQYTAQYTVRVHPPLQYDDEDAHLNLKLAATHIPYRSVDITIPGEYVKDIWVRPSSFETILTDGNYHITGTAGENVLIEVEMLLDPAYLNAIDGFPVKTDAVRQQTETAALFYSIPALLSSLMLLLGRIGVIAAPVFLIVIFLRHGQEKQAVIPEHISFVPDPSLLPWQVNLLFKGDAIEFDENGFYATILDLHRRGFLRVTEHEDASGVDIQVVKTVSDDAYEQRVINFVSNAGTGGVLDTRSFAAAAESPAAPAPAPALGRAKYVASGPVTCSAQRSVRPWRRVTLTMNSTSWFS